MQAPQIFSRLTVIARNRSNQSDEFGQELFGHDWAERGWNISPRFWVIVVMSEVVSGDLVSAKSRQTQRLGLGSPLFFGEISQMLRSFLALFGFVKN